MPGVQVTLAEFRLAVALVSSRTLAVRAADGDVAIKYMVPLMDMANHRQGSVHQASGTKASRAPRHPGVARPPANLLSRRNACGWMRSVDWDSRPVMYINARRARARAQVRQSATGALQLVAGEAVAQGEEIFISYGALCPDETAMHYGA